MFVDVVTGPVDPLCRRRRGVGFFASRTTPSAGVRNPRGGGFPTPSRAFFRDQLWFSRPVLGAECPTADVIHGVVVDEDAAGHRFCGRAQCRDSRSERVRCSLTDASGRDDDDRATKHHHRPPATGRRGRFVPLARSARPDARRSPRRRRRRLQHPRRRSRPLGREAIPLPHGHPSQS